MTEAWDIWRAANLVLAISAIAINVVKAAQLDLFHKMEIDSAVGFLGILAWCLGYVVATSYAWSQGLPPGPWTAVMSIPILWTLIAGILRPRSRVDDVG